MSVSDLARHRSKKVIFERYITTGYNYRMSDIHAAIGIEQLKKLPSMLGKLRRIATAYTEGFKDVKWLKLPAEPSYCRTNWQSYSVRVLDNAPLTRNELMQRLLDKGISTRRGIMNAHQEPAYASRLSLKNSEAARNSMILLPLFYEMSPAQIKNVVDVIKDI